MKEKIKEICERLNRDQASVYGATNELFDLFSVVQQSELLFCYHKGSYTLNKDGTCCKCHRPLEPKAK